MNTCALTDAPFTTRVPKEGTVGESGLIGHNASIAFVWVPAVSSGIDGQCVSIDRLMPEHYLRIKMRIQVDD